MYNYSQVINGIAKYIDNEIINKMTGYQKWILGTGVGLYLNKGTETFNIIKQNPIIQSLGIIDSEDNIDVDMIYQELKKQAQKSAVTFNVPMIGPMTLNESDVDKLYSCIKGI